MNTLLDLNASVRAHPTGWPCTTSAEPAGRKNKTMTAMVAVIRSAATMRMAISRKMFLSFPSAVIKWSMS